MVVQKIELPSDSVLKKNHYDYADSYSGKFIDTNNEVNILLIAKAFFSSSPKWIGKLFVIRNRIVSVFGLKTGNKIEDPLELINNFEGNTGEQLGLFKVYKKTESEIILGENDKHLDFRVSLLLSPNEINKKEKDITISTTVNFNNWLGKLYFFPVKPFHKLIVPIILKEIIKKINQHTISH